jgi:hypothetical protein
LLKESSTSFSQATTLPVPQEMHPSIATSLAALLSLSLSYNATSTPLHRILDDTADDDASRRSLSHAIGLAATGTPSPSIQQAAVIGLAAPWPPAGKMLSNLQGPCTNSNFSENPALRLNILLISS